MVFWTRIKNGPERYPYVLLHGRVHGPRPVGRPRKKWLDNIHNDCVDMGTTIIEATQWTANRSQWGCTVQMYHQHHGPPTHIDIVFIARAISQVSKSCNKTTRMRMRTSRDAHHTIGNGLILQIEADKNEKKL